MDFSFKNEVMATIESYTKLINRAEKKYLPYRSDVQEYLNIITQNDYIALSGHYNLKYSIVYDGNNNQLYLQIQDINKFNLTITNSCIPIYNNKFENKSDRIENFWQKK